MWTPQRLHSPHKSKSIRNRSIRRRSIDHINLNKTTAINPKDISQDKLKSNITEFVFDENKKKNEIGRIIDDYFDETIHYIRPK